MATNWHTYAVRPLPIGGAGEVRAQIDGVAEAVRVLVGAAPASSSTDHACLAVDLDHWEDGTWRAPFFGGLRGQAVASFFVRKAGAWEAGPVVTGIPLNWTHDVVFPWVKGWAIARLQEISSAMPILFEDRPLPILGAFPRAGMPMPSLTVQVQASGQASTTLSDHLSPGFRGRQYNISLTVECWAETPEDRDAVYAWMGGAMEVLLDACRAQGWEEPSGSLDESEIPGNASPLEIPIFQATMRLALGAWSRLNIPSPRFYGRLAVL